MAAPSTMICGRSFLETLMMPPRKSDVGRRIGQPRSIFQSASGGAGNSTCTSAHWPCISRTQWAGASGLRSHVAAPDESICQTSRRGPSAQAAPASPTNKPNKIKVGFMFTLRCCCVLHLPDAKTLSRLVCLAQGAKSIAREMQVMRPLFTSASGVTSAPASPGGASGTCRSRRP